MRNAGRKVWNSTKNQTSCKLSVHAIPHPTSLRSATFPPGEGFGVRCKLPHKLPFDTLSTRCTFPQGKVIFYSHHRKFMNVGTSFSQSASQWPPPTWQWSFTAAPEAAIWSPTRLFQP